MLCRISACVLVAILSVTVSGEEPNVPGDLRIVQGNWKPASLKFEEFDTMPAEMLKQMTGVYDGSEFHLYFVERGREGPRPLKLMVAKVTLDAGTNPKTMTFECDRGALKGHKLHGIYEITDNTLKLCYGPADKPRPSTFAAPKGSGAFSEVWLRQAK